MVLTFLPQKNYQYHCKGFGSPARPGRSLGDPARTLGSQEAEHKKYPPAVMLQMGIGLNKDFPICRFFL